LEVVIVRNAAAIIRAIVLVNLWYMWQQHHVDAKASLTPPVLLPFITAKMMTEMRRQEKGSGEPIIALVWRVSLGSHHVVPVLMSKTLRI